jgi:uncharacterized protein (TIGR02246 family)
MGLQPLVIVALAALSTGDTQQAVTKEVEEAVHAIQTAFNKGDAATLKQLMMPDIVVILPYARFSSAADQLKVLSHWKYSDYKIEGLQVKALTKDVALVVYRATIKGTYKGEAVPSPVQVGEVWVKRGERWRQASYQETPVGSK